MQGDNKQTLKTLEDNSIDAIVTDPPYGIDFLSKAWDANTGALETYTECLRVLKPGGYILAFSAARTYHHLAVTLEQAGFEIRDQLMWLYASGFPKAQDIGKGLDKRGTANNYHGWKTALKPAHEPIAMARKPFKGSTIDTVLTYGVGALNIDATRLDGKYTNNVIGEVEGYQKFFYCPKVSRRERHCGFDAPPDPLANYSQGDVKNHPLWDPSIGTNVQRLKHKILEHNKTIGEDHTVVGNVGNNHPTVKPVALMRYLIQLITPPNSTVLDPFNGSGSTGMAAVELGHTYIGCELDPAYVEIAQRRIAAWNTKEPTSTNFDEIFE